MNRIQVKTFFLFFVLFFIAFNFSNSFAKDRGVKNQVKKTLKNNLKKNSDTKSSLDTSFSFDSSKIKGKVNSSNMRKVIVEDDKYVNDLLGIRNNFSDRELEESERSLQW